MKELIDAIREQERNIFLFSMFITEKKLGDEFSQWMIKKSGVVEETMSDLFKGNNKTGERDSR